LAQSKQNVSWLPVDIAARAVLDLASSTPAPASTRFFHVCSPPSTAWSDVLPLLKTAGLHFGILKTDEWLRRVEGTGNDASSNPSIKLLPFWQSIVCVCVLLLWF
jgi:hypothetical protein